MKALIIFLIIISFLQTTILPVNLGLIVLICRSYIRNDPYNLILAFAFGVLLSHLTLTTFGVYSLLFIFIIQFVKAVSKTRFAANPLFIIPLAFLGIYITDFITSFIYGLNFIFDPWIFIHAIFALPIFYIVRLWEERYIVRKEIKLKV